MPAYAGIQILDSGFRRNDDASVGVLTAMENKMYSCVGVPTEKTADKSTPEQFTGSVDWRLNLGSVLSGLPS